MVISWSTLDTLNDGMTASWFNGYYLHSSVSHTTCCQKPKESHGRDYYFIDESTFERAAKSVSQYMWHISMRELETNFHKPGEVDGWSLFSFFRVSLFKQWKLTGDYMVSLWLLLSRSLSKDWPVWLTWAWRCVCTLCRWRFVHILYWDG